MKQDISSNAVSTILDKFSEVAVRGTIPELNTEIERIGFSVSDIPLLEDLLLLMVYETGREFLLHHLAHIEENKNNEDPSRQFNELATGEWLYKSAFLINIAKKLSTHEPNFHDRMTKHLERVFETIQAFETENPNATRLFQIKPSALE